MITVLKKIIPQPIFKLFQPAYHWLLAFVAALVYHFPSSGLKVIGVTGTNGKTTVVALLHHIFTECGFKTASISSLRFKVLDEEKKNELKMTMPGRFFIQKFLRSCVKRKIEYVILEVTSEGVRQSRHKFIKFDAGVLTNVTPEHIESHGSFEKYMEAKLSFFQSLSSKAAAIINRDDPSFDKFFRETPAKKISYGKERITSGIKDYSVRELFFKKDGTSFFLDGAEFNSPLLGEFNFYNILAAVATAISQDMRFERVRRAVASFKGVPGRLEFIQKEPFGVVVDYAHTPDALRKVYQTLRVTLNMSHATCRIICVLGSAGGGRDKWKRPEMGKIASEFCDKIILTNEDPYDENPSQILSEIKSGITNDKLQMTNEILDRREAIREALKSAREGDTVIITGKGAEPWIMGPNNTKIPWDDREVAKEELQKIK